MAFIENAPASSPSSLRTAARRSSTWSNHFGIQQPLRHLAEDDRLPLRDGETLCRAFIDGHQDALSPPCLNWEPLESFLNWADPRDLLDRRRCPTVSKLCLIDDRASASCKAEPLDGAPHDFDSPPRDVGTEKLEVIAFRKALNEQDLYDRLLQKRLENHADRRVLLITNLSHLCAFVLAATVAHRFAATLKGFLQSFITGEIYFFADWQGPNSPRRKDSDDRLQAEDKYSLGFHLSYVAIRKGAEQPDPLARGIRESYPMIKQLEGPAEELFYYDAQTSFLITGVDESQWTAYCCVDTYFGSKENIHTYFAKGQDGPSGGVRAEEDPCWNPREYFLLVLSQRLRQATREWGNVITVLMTRLDSYEGFYIRTIDTEGICDDVSMTRTKQYTKAVSILCQFHDTLFATISSLEKFLDGNRHFFDNNGEMGDPWSCYFDSLGGNLIHLRMWERRLKQRMKRFSGMRDGLVNASALQESRRSTKLGKDIGILTNLTVAYLPFNLAAGVFSISDNLPKGLIWLYWTVTWVSLSILTFYFAFGRKLLNTWGTKGWNGQKH